MQASNIILDKETSKRCPKCGHSTIGMSRMRSFENSISNFLLTLNASGSSSLDAKTCLMCIEKHIGDAMTLYKELITADGSGNNSGEASVNTYRNHLEIIGNLCEAYKESTDFIELHDLILISERNYRYEGIEPDWNRIMELMLKEKNKISK